MALSVCAGCSRHVRSSDTSCPFCGVARAAGEVPRRSAHPSTLSRASLVFGQVAALAAVASAVACSPAEPPASPVSPSPSSVAPIDTAPVAMYGAPPAVDSGAGPAPQPSSAPSTPPQANGPGADDPPGMGTVYGAPPLLQDPDAPKPKPKPKPAPKAPKK